MAITLNGLAIDDWLSHYRRRNPLHGPRAHHNLPNDGLVYGRPANLPDLARAQHDFPMYDTCNRGPRLNPLLARMDHDAL